MLYIRKKAIIALTITIIIVKCLLNQKETRLNDTNIHENKNKTETLADFYSEKIAKSPIIFIGGYPRSGTTLIRAILDVHPAVSCGPETIILPPLLKFIKTQRMNRKFIKDFAQAGFNISLIETSTALFIYEIMEGHLRRAKHLCAKDPDILYYMDYLHKVFPSAKFIYMIRDGRACAYSSLVQIKEPKLYRYFMKYFRTWIGGNMIFNNLCEKVGDKVCKRVRYENLVSKPKETLMDLVEFLNLTWTDDFLKYNEFVGDKVVVSQVEWSSDQIRKPIHTNSIRNWVGNIPDFNLAAFKRESNFLVELGYDDISLF